MRIYAQRKLTEALAVWGLHEAEGRLRGKLPQMLIPPADGPGRDPAGVELALRYRSPYVSRILGAGPLIVFSVEIEPGDREGVHIADGRPLPEWTAAISAQNSKEGRHVLGLAHGAARVDGHLVCAAHAPDGNPEHLFSPIIIYDGWHRAAAWSLQADSGQSGPISADLILTHQLDAALKVVPR